MDNQLSLATPSVTMSSLELLEVINRFRAEDGKSPMRHANFMQKIEDELQGGELKFQSSYLTPQNKQAKCYNLPKRECLLMAMRESKSVRRKSVDYIESLENQQSQAVSIPQSLPEALRLAAELAEERDAAIETVKVQNVTIDAQEETIDHLENFLEGGMTIPAFGKMLNGVNSSQLVNYCRDKLQWVYDSSGRRTFRAYHKARDKYLREVPVYVKNLYYSEEDVMSIVLLDKGARKLYKLYREGKLPMKKTWNGQFTYANFNTEEAA